MRSHLISDLLYGMMSLFSFFFVFCFPVLGFPRGLCRDLLIWESGMAGYRWFCVMNLCRSGIFISSVPRTGDWESGFEVWTWR